MLLGMFNWLVNGLWISLDCCLWLYVVICCLYMGSTRLYGLLYGLTMAPQPRLMFPTGSSIDFLGLDCTLTYTLGSYTDLEDLWLVLKKTNKSTNINIYIYCKNSAW